MIGFLLWVGLIAKRHDGTTAWPFHIPPWHIFRYHLKRGPRFYRFRNLDGVVKWRKDRLLPRRWGGGFCGIEFGDRGH